MPGAFRSFSLLFRAFWGVLVVAVPGCSAPQPAGPAAVQWATDSTTVRLAAGPEYTRSAVWQFFWGAHYRAIWATPVTVPVLRLATAELDSLTPLQAGGSYQSHTLRLRTATGRQLVLRSVDKDMSAALPAGWKRNLLRGLMKDQTSATLPYGAYVAARLAESVGVYHANPRLVYLPDDKALGKFRAAYANALYLLEERAEGNQRAEASFGHSPAILNSRRMLTALRERPNAQVVARAYLRARLLDLWLGDWSRREDQWRWASFSRAGHTGFRPIPRDRDQAFFLFDDGFCTRVLSWFLIKFQSFHAIIQPGNVNGLTTTARALDRTLLSPLSADDFRQVADSMRLCLTDAVIADALAAGPVETQAAIAVRLGPLLRARRAQLPAVARRYYELLAAEAWLVGTDKAERFVLRGAGPGRLRVQVLACRARLADSLLTERVYDRHETRQLDLYGLAGDDMFDISPTAAVGIAVNIYPGAGRNQARVMDARQQAAGPAALAGFRWYETSMHGAGTGGLRAQPDPHPALTANAQGWLIRYNLRD